MMGLSKPGTTCGARGESGNSGRARFCIGRPARAGLLPLLLLLSACATSRPVLYPTSRLSVVGVEAAEREVDACMERAQADVGYGRETTALGGTVVGGASGAAAGAAGGAVVGRAGTAAAVGGAAGAARGLVRGLFRSLEPDPTYRRYVSRCLRSRGFEVAGWR